MVGASARSKPWTNGSVLALAGKSDPVQVISEKARDLALQAIENGWAGPPYDPLKLAESLQISVVASQDIADARTIPSPVGFTIEFNPNRPRNRVKYSICHEIAHTLFPDCADRIRHRLTHREMQGDDWQLETLCNIGAAELLMPIGSVPELERDRFGIDAVLRARKQHEVSVEAVLLRAVRLSKDQCSIFSASRRAPGRNTYYVDYAVESRAWNVRLLPGTAVSDGSVVADCVAIGFTAKAHEQWPDIGSVSVECVGVPAYPNQTYPRVLGVVRPQKQQHVKTPTVTYLQGDALQPRGHGSRILAQLVNDAAFAWGAGFSKKVRERWPDAQTSFRHWAEQDRKNLRLGNVHVTRVEGDLWLASVIAQKGFGESTKPRIRYSHLQRGLEQVADLAKQKQATVHMPRMGTGLAGGSWSIIGELVESAICDRGTDVYVYDLPGAVPRTHPQTSLQFTPTVNA